MDSDADAFVAGRNCFLMQYAERVCDVMLCLDEHEPKSNTSIVQVVSGYITSCSKMHV